MNYFFVRGGYELQSAGKSWNAWIKIMIQSLFIDGIVERDSVVDECKPTPMPVFSLPTPRQRVTACRPISRSADLSEKKLGSETCRLAERRRDCACLHVSALRDLAVLLAAIMTIIGSNTFLSWCCINILRAAKKRRVCMRVAECMGMGMDVAHALLHFPSAGRRIQFTVSSHALYRIGRMMCLASDRRSPHLA